MRRKPHLHSVTRQNPQKIYPAPFGDAGQNLLAVAQGHAVEGARQLFNHFASYVSALFYLVVSTHGPFSVIATVCSKWAAADPSVVTAVQRSDKTCVSG